ncbi:VCBS repeat-containing protein [Pelagicoccus sp. SDUM812002]|uniref:VCBS repeat-containing protein n=1 Tax=Pelagicoccus sp. SDUM812002 TaxID=3041266 RepID=UPI00280F9F28|nr:VCBS repeat-containing protein [Pelagicoccus sp. SDUM812002]MDQ8187186.1 VCBS repeat-containing protein [Pelagicoccus sp. SDUM812002]
MPFPSRIASLFILPIAIGAPPLAHAGFEILEADTTGLHLENEYNDPLMWSTRFREFTLGAVSIGIASGDLNGDGRPDIYAVSKTGPNGLYLQKETPLVFEDHAAASGVLGTEHWETGVTLVDIDNDQDLDIYLCVYDAPNQLYINDGAGNFQEQAASFGLDLHDASVMAAFSDYDRDGDLDVYLQTNVLEFARNTKGSPDYLYRNNGDNTFTDVSRDSSIWGRSQGHSATWWDYNNDGWPDLYVANDFETPDRFYKNNGDGTFTDAIEELVPLTTFFSMGSDLGDLNNDGWMDFMVADMEAADHYKDMTGMEERSRGIWDTEAVFELTPQYARNAIYLNTGLDRFQEAAYLFGVPGTNWTWSVKLNDLDNDGWLDLYITNGMVRNLIDADLVDRQNTARSLAHRALVVKNSEPLAEHNFAFRNTGDLGFEDVSSEWNLDQASVAFGSTVCDFDRDGKLDIAYLGMDQAITLAHNTIGADHNYLSLRLRGTVSNSWGLGAIVSLHNDNGQQLRQLNLARGIVSSDEPILHFGLGEAEQSDLIEIKWPSGRIQTLQNVAANQLLVVTEPESNNAPQRYENNNEYLFRERPDLAAKWPKHQQTDTGEFNRAPLLPRLVGQNGPALAQGDLDGDGKYDFYIGGGFAQSGTIVYSTTGPQDVGRDETSEDIAAAIFDANADGLNDLLVVSGGAPRPGLEQFSDRLYLNNGDRTFTKASEDTWPGDKASGSTIAVGDYDQDGDTDVFIGGFATPESYPFPQASRILRNDSSTFKDVTAEIAVTLQQAGLVTGSSWIDLEGDGTLELAVLCEWSHLSVFKLENGEFKDVSKDLGLSSKTGLWRSLSTADLNGDGRPDFIVGNLGLNTKYEASDSAPATLLAGDIEGDGRIHTIEAYYEKGRLYPVRGRSKLNYSFPWVKDDFKKFNDFALAEMADVFGSERLARARRFEATELQSGVWVSVPSNTYKFIPFPRSAQLAPTMGMVSGDWNGDQIPDLILAQNFYGQEASTGRLTGSIGATLIGKGDGSFEVLSPSDTGLKLPGNQRALAKSDLDGDGNYELIATENGGPVRIFSIARGK